MKTNNTADLVDVKPKSMHTFKKLGFSKMETAELVKNLDPLLCSYAVHYQKLRNFHWNVSGSEFFELHDKFEELYNEVQEHIDEIAERIRVFGQHPSSTLKDFIDNSQIKEPATTPTALGMVKEIIDDFEQLLTQLTETLDQAVENGDVGTELMMQRYIAQTEKHHWMLSSYLN